MSESGTPADSAPHGDGDRRFEVYFEYHDYEYDRGATQHDECVEVFDADDRSDAIQLAKDHVSYDVDFVQTATEVCR